MKRKEFIKLGSLSGFAISSGLLAATPKIQDGEKFDEKVVQEFVGLAHRDMEKVKSMLEEYPNLINTAHDWKNGDFETALGAASHVGYKELASYLIENGAQVNIFTAALFGRTDIIKPILDFFPSALNAKGPHGFTLYHHAIRGGEEALETKEYLERLGAKETKIALY